MGGSVKALTRFRVFIDENAPLGYNLEAGTSRFHVTQSRRIYLPDICNRVHF